MSKLNRISVVIFITVIVLILFKLCIYGIYSVDRIEKLLNSIELPKNVYIKTSYYNNEDKIIGVSNLYENGNIIYIFQENDCGDVVEQIYNLDSSIHITIDHSQKSITNTVINEKVELKPEGIDNFAILKKTNKQYRYNGKEYIDGKKCIKISFTNQDTNSIGITYFYISIEDKYIIKTEYYEGSSLNSLNKISSQKFEYLFNTVTDKDILSFDIEKYKDYQYFD